MYGFTTDPIPIALKIISATSYLQTPYNLYCHNLCEKLQPPPGFNHLLILDLNFCIKKYHLKPNVKYTLEKLNRSVRLQAWIKDGASDEVYQSKTTWIHYLGTYGPRSSTVIS
jgi:hypothetical protein